MSETPTEVPTGTGPEEPTTPVESPAPAEAPATSAPSEPAPDDGIDHGTEWDQKPPTSEQSEAERQGEESAGEGREPGDFVGISPAAYDKVGAKAVDLDRQSAYLPSEDVDLTKGADGARTPFVEA